MTGTKTTRSTSKKTATTTSTRRKSAKTKTATKSITPSAARKKAAPVSAKPAPKVVSVKDPVLAKPDLRKKELIDAAVERSGLKKKDAKPAIEAALAVLGDALSEGRDLNLRPLGKLKIQRSEDKANGTVIVCRIRQPSQPVSKPADPVAHAAE